MIHAQEFTNTAFEHGYRFYAAVPCSFLTPLIDCVTGDQRLIYLCSANEGDAVASAIGATLGGQRAIVMMQNSGLGNAVSPLASLSWPFRIPVLLVVTLRGDPELYDEPQHEMMGRATGALLDLLQISWEPFPTESYRVAPVLRRATAHMTSSGRPYALVMRRGALQPFATAGRCATRATGPVHVIIPPTSHSSVGAVRPKRAEVLQRVRERTPPDDSVVIASTGYTGRELYALGDRPNHFYMVGSMGCATSLGLGLSLARPDVRVVVLEGDGAALMRMGNYATIGGYGGGNFVHLLLDNEMHESTGGQPTVSSGVSFAGIAAACGYACAIAGDTTDLVDRVLDQPLDGPRFAQIKIRPGVETSLPRPQLSPCDVTYRFRAHLGSGI